MASIDGSPGKLKGRGTRARKTRVIKRETYSKRDFKGFRSGEEIFDTISKLIEDDEIAPNKREGIYCTVYKHLQSNARTSMIHDMTPDLDGAANLDTKELLAVLLSISLRDVERLIRNSTQELKVDVFVELSEGEALLTRFPVRYYTTTEDLVSYVLKDRGVTDSVLDYQLAVIKSPFKGKSKIKSIMCAVGGNNNHSLAGKPMKVLYPHQYPLQELGATPKVEYTNTDGIPRVTSCYLYVSPRDAQQLTVHYRRPEDGTEEEETLSLRSSATAQDVIEEAVQHFGLANDPLAYRLIMKAYAFDETTVSLEDQPLTLMEQIEDCQEGFPQIWIEDQEVEAVERSNSFIRKHSSRRGSRKKPRHVPPLAEDPGTLETDSAAPEPDLDKSSPSRLEEEEEVAIPRSNTEISRIQSHLYQTSLRRKTQSTKHVGVIKEQESHLKTILVEQDKVISALNSAVKTAEESTCTDSLSPQNSIKEVSLTKLKEALAEKQTQIWELEENRDKDREALSSLTLATKALEGKFREVEDKFRAHKNTSKHELEMERRERRQLEKDLERASSASSAAVVVDTDPGQEDKLAEMRLQVDKDQEIIDITTQRNAELKDEIKHLKTRLLDHTSHDMNKLEVDAIQRNSINESMSINDFTEWSKDLDDLKKRNDQLLYRNKQLTSDNIKLTEAIDQSRNSQRAVNEMKQNNQNLREANEDLNISIRAREGEISQLTERLTVSSQDNDGSFDEYQEKYYDLFEKNQRLESIMSGTIEKLRSKLSVVDDEKVQLNNTINGLSTDLEGKKRQLKELDYMKNRVEMMEMEHSHLKEFSSQLIEENKSIDDLNRNIEERDQKVSDLSGMVSDMRDELLEFRGLEKVNCGVQIEDPRIEDLESRLEEAIGRVDSRSAVVESMNKKLTQKEEEIVTVKGMASDFEQTNLLLTAEMERLKKQNASLESKGTQKTDEISSFKMIMDALNEQIASTKGLCEEEQCPSALRLKHSHETHLSNMQDAMRDSEVNFNKYSTLTAELSSLQDKHDELQDSFSILEADKADADDTVSANEKSLKDNVEKISELMSLTSSLRSEVDRGNEKAATLTAKRDELAKELTNTRLKNADIESEHNELQENLRSFKRKTKQAKEHAESLQNLNEALSAQIEEMQTEGCSQNKCPSAVELLKRDVESKKVNAEVDDLRNQRKDLQNVVIKSKNELAEAQIEYQELEAHLLETKENAESYRAQLRRVQRKLDPRKRKDHIDNLENQVEMYQAEVTSLKSVTRNMEDEIDRISVVGEENGNVVQRLNEQNASLDRQLGDAKGEIYDLEEQLQKFKDSLRESQKESATVDMYLSERQMLKDSIDGLETEHKSVCEERDQLKTSFVAVTEELSIVKGVRDIQTRDSASTVQTSMKLKKQLEESAREITKLKGELQRKVEEVDDLKTHSEMNGGVDLDISQNSDSGNNPKLNELNTTISDLSSTVRHLTHENLELETSISEMNEEEVARQEKIAELEVHFHREVEHLHEEYKSKICSQTEEIRKWVNQNKVLSEEILMLEQAREQMERMSLRGSQIPDQVEMQDKLQEANQELSLQNKMMQKSMAQYEDAQLQIDSMEQEILSYKKKINGSEKITEDLSRRLEDNDKSLDEYRQQVDDLQGADDTKRAEIRLLNKLVKEHTSRADEAEHEYGSLKSRYSDKKTQIDDLQKELVQLRHQNAEYENVIVALESTSATDTVDNSSHKRRINELQGLLSEAEAVASARSAELEQARLEQTRLQEETEGLVEEVRSYQEEWRRLTSLLSSVNTTNHANLDSCRRLEDKMDDIEYKVSETNVHIEICEGDMFSRTEALVRENELLEQKISEKSASLDQSERFLRESHENIELLQTGMQELRGRLDTSVRGDECEETAEEEVEELRYALAETEELLREARSEKDGDEAAFKVSLDTIVRSYEDRMAVLTQDLELRDQELGKLRRQCEENR